jgi:hypothetical protein
MFVGTVEDSTNQSSQTTNACKNWKLPNAEVRRLSSEMNVHPNQKKDEQSAEENNAKEKTRVNST